VPYLIRVSRTNDAGQAYYSKLLRVKDNFVEKADDAALRRLVGEKVAAVIRTFQAGQGD